MAKSTAVDQNDDETTRQKLDAQRIEFGNTVKSYFPVLFILTVVIATLLIVLSALGFVLGRTMDATVIAASVQVAFGMVLGFVCVYIGLMMTWLGIDAAYSVKGDIGPGSLVLKSASPGLLFALGGMVLVSVSLHKQIVYEESGRNIVGTQPVVPGALHGTVDPRAPQHMELTPAGTSYSTQPQSSEKPRNPVETLPDADPI